jgi:hypothetical protein
MIVGNGDIASILEDRFDVIFFAAGVSNSSETREDEFQREMNLLKEQDTSKCIFYFSSIALDDTSVDTPYLNHKRKVEQFIKLNFKNYNIIRIGNITWGKNPNTFINYIKNKLSKGEEVEIKDVYRFVINQKDLLLLTKNLPSIGQNQISIFSKMGKVKDFL